MISPRQAVCIIMFFIFGSSVIMGINSTARQDSWISLLMVPFLMFPMLLVYGRIMRLFPEKDFFEAIEIIFGKVFGKLFIILMTWYALHLCALVLRNFSEFIEISFMPETPQVAIMIAMMLVTIYMSVSGIETMGRWSVGMLPFVLGVAMLTTALAVPKMDFTNILPVMEHSVKTIAGGSYKLFTFPFAETVLFLCLADSVRKKDSPYKIYIYAMIFSLLVLLMVILRNTFLLGPELLAAEYFPSFTTARIVDVGDFMARIEGTIAMNFILTGIVKITVCLIAAAKGMSKLFQTGNYRWLVFPMGMLTVAFSSIVYENAMEMFDFLEIYQYYAIPFEIIIPLLLWILAEIQARRQKQKILTPKEDLS